MKAVPALRITASFLPAVIKGAEAMASGEYINPAIASTLSWVSSSWTMAFASAPFGALESRLTNVIL